MGIMKFFVKSLPYKPKLYLKKIRNFFTSLEYLKLYKTKTGYFYMPFFSYQDIIKKKILENKIWGEEVYNISKKFIKNDTIVLDAGANFGQMSILFSQLEKNVEVYSFESSKFISNILKKNVIKNNANVKVFNCILGNESNRTYIIKKKDLSNFSTWGSNRVEIINQQSKNYNNEEVQTLRIDDLIFKKKISFFKIDVQGFDLEVLKGSKNTILKHKMPIIFEYEEEFEKYYNYTFSDFKNFISEVNYKIETNLDGKNILILPN